MKTHFMRCFLGRIVATGVIGFSLMATGSLCFAEKDGKTVGVLILFEKPPGRAQADLVRSHGGKVERTFSIVPAVSAQLPEAAMEALAKRKGVKAVELDGEVKAHEIQNVWGVQRIGCASLHDGSYSEAGIPARGLGVKVAIVDSGIDYDHPELVWNFAGGIDFVNNDADPMDDQGHGTHVAGTVGAIRDSSGVVGVAPEVDLYGVKVLASDGRGSWSWIISALDWCIDQGIQVANFSLGSSGNPGTTVEAAFNNAESRGLVLVASAGNSGSGADTVGYPAKYNSVIAVASTTSSDARSSFSSTGPDVEVAAPGSSIYSTIMGGGFGYKSGTSMAAPHTAGVAALLIAAGISDSNGNARINDEVRQTLRATAEDLGTSGPDNSFGYGLIDAEKAVIVAEGGTPPGPEPAFDAPSDLTGTPAVSSISLAWTDNAETEEGFEIEFGVKQKGRTTWSRLGFAPADATSFASPINPGKYRFRVRAFKDNQSSYTSWSNEITVSIEGSSGGGGGGGGGGNGGGKGGGPRR